MNSFGVWIGSWCPGESDLFCFLFRPQSPLVRFGCASFKNLSVPSASASLGCRVSCQRISAFLIAPNRPILGYQGYLIAGLLSLACLAGYLRLVDGAAYVAGLSIGLG